MMHPRRRSLEDESTGCIHRAFQCCLCSVHITAMGKDRGWSRTSPHWTVYHCTRGTTTISGSRSNPMRLSDASKLVIDVAKALGDTASYCVSVVQRYISEGCVHVYVHHTDNRFCKNTQPGPCGLHIYITGHRDRLALTLSGH
jgi:hypothetical protein